MHITADAQTRVDLKKGRAFAVSLWPHRSFPFVDPAIRNDETEGVGAGNEGASIDAGVGVFGCSGWNEEHVTKPTDFGSRIAGKSQV